MAYVGILIYEIIILQDYIFHTGENNGWKY